MDHDETGSDQQRPDEGMGEQHDDRASSGEQHDGGVSSGEQHDDRASSGEQHDGVAGSGEQHDGGASGGEQHDGGASGGEQHDGGASSGDRVRHEGGPLRLGQGTGPLRGVRVVELAGIGPGPHACMTLADLGADVIRVEGPRPMLAVVDDPRHDLLTRGRPNIVLDLKNPEGREALLRLVDTADVLVEGYRPGAAERLGVGPEDCRERNPRLVYARMTGWGQTGPLAQTAGHDLNYVALSGILHGLGQDPARPHFPTNLVGDFGGGSTYLVIGILSALLERGVSGEGQVVDAAIVDGTAHLAAMTWARAADGASVDRRGTGMLEGGLPFYDLYETSDGEHLSVGPLEPQFYRAFVETLGVADQAPGQLETGRFEELRTLLTETFRTRTRDEWAELFVGTDACVAPVLHLSEVPEHPHMRERGVVVEHEGVAQPAPAPRFSRTQASLGLPPGRPGQHTREALLAWGIEDAEALIEAGAAIQH